MENLNNELPASSETDPFICDKCFEEYRLPVKLLPNGVMYQKQFDTHRCADTDDVRNEK